MKKSNLTIIDITDLDVFINFYNLRRDIHLFVDYVKSRDVKRAYRSNLLSKADYKRLAKLMSVPDAFGEIEMRDRSSWVDFIDELTLKLRFVTYDTKGKYIGYTSSYPSFPDNYIKFNLEKYNTFLNQPLQIQEKQIFDIMTNDYSESNNEFFKRSLFGKLRPFSYVGCATGVVPTLNFAKIRSFLFTLLKECESGQWYSTSSLVDYLKKEHTFFLIPEKPNSKYKWEKIDNRYVNFVETKKEWGQGPTISDRDSDGFERVEGRYVERFLENIPLILGYVDVAYSKKIAKKSYPTAFNTLKAFRINERFHHFMEGTISSPKITVQPNFEVHIESEFYPVQIISHLLPLADIVSEDIITVMKLNKNKVAAQLVEDENLNVLDLMTKLSDNPLPQNIVIELQEWTGHAEKFILYEGLGLFEGDKNLAVADSFTVENISPGLRIIQSPEKLYTKLVNEELIPLLITHSDKSLTAVPDKVRTHFPHKSQKSKKSKLKKALNLTRKTMITLLFQEETVLNEFSKALLDAHCPVEVNSRDLTLTYSKIYEEQFNEVMKNMNKEYTIKFEDSLS
jgi:hypothetical protein